MKLYFLGFLGHLVWFVAMKTNPCLRGARGPILQVQPIPMAIASGRYDIRSGFQGGT